MVHEAATKKRQFWLQLKYRKSVLATVEYLMERQFWLQLKYGTSVLDTNTYAVGKNSEKLDFGE